MLMPFVKNNILFLSKYTYNLQTQHIKRIGQQATEA